MAKTVKSGEFCKIVEANGWYYVDIGKVSIHCTGQTQFSANEIFRVIERHSLDVTESD